MATKAGPVFVFVFLHFLASHAWMISQFGFNKNFETRKVSFNLMTKYAFYYTIVILKLLWLLCPLFNTFYSVSVSYLDIQDS